MFRTQIYCAVPRTVLRILNATWINILKPTGYVKLVKCYIWSMALYGAETWTFRASDKKYLESFEMWCWRRMEKISWTDHVRNEEVLLTVNEQRNSYMK